MADDVATYPPRQASDPVIPMGAAKVRYVACTEVLEIE